MSTCARCPHAEGWHTGAGCRAFKCTCKRFVAEIPARPEWTPYEGVKRAQRDLFGGERRPSTPKRRWERAL